MYKRYKTTRRQRQKALAYYYANKKERLRYAESYRRAKGVLPHRPAMTNEEKLARVVICRGCGQRVVTPSLLKAYSQWCLRCKRKKHPQRPETRRRSVTAWRKRQIAMVRKEKLRRGCEQCGIKPRSAHQLDWHHRDPKMKLFRVGNGAGRFGWTKVRAEMAKCDVLCKACHKKQH